MTEHMLLSKTNSNKHSLLTSDRIVKRLALASLVLE